MSNKYSQESTTRKRFAAHHEQLSEITKTVDDVAKRLEQKIERMENNEGSHKMTSELIESLREQLASKQLELSHVTAERDHAVNALDVKENELLALKKNELKRSKQQEKNDCDSFKKQIAELELKLSEKNSELKEKNEILENMRISRKQAKKDHQKKIKSMAKEMETKIEEIDKFCQEKMMESQKQVQQLEEDMKDQIKEIEMAWAEKSTGKQNVDSDCASEISMESGFFELSGRSTPEPTNDFDAIPASTYGRMCSMLNDSAERIQYLEATLYEQNNWMENYLSQTSFLISYFFMQNSLPVVENVLMTMRSTAEEELKWEEQIRREIDDIESRIRDIEFWESLL
ncbi:hypothetical protein GCK72_019246 [Caenorhabditis remanei]|uniref:Uncharacterized protein n=1 Tax=Caenorhabditis remanei TaxID=31234 RepID=A0A6A5GD88_CAERE|nr:hypothetical protein GCK72_019246 [Caenorhabditis remanei]KAF1752691.1 hypothetical protein GCK72_019246 [Caenorhabditis remanei]